MSVRQQGIRQQGFTLVELVVAVAILGATVMGLLFLRVTALDRVGKSHHERYLQRIAQQKLDEVMFGLEAALEGDLEDDPRVHWRIEGHEIGSTTSPTSSEASTSETETSEYVEPQRLIECQVTVTFEVEGRPDEEPEEYRLTSWIFPPPGSLLAEQLGLATPEEEFR